MHELLLYGQVPRTRHEQVLKVLAGVAAMQPRRVLKRHIVYKPIRDPEEPGSHLKRGGMQNVSTAKNTKQGGAKDLYYTQLVQQLKESDFGRGDEQMDVDGQETGGVWTLEFNDIPEAGDRGGVLVRGMNSTELGGSDPHAYMTSLGYQFVSEYYVEGHRYVHDNVVIFLHRILHEPGVRSLETAPKQVIPAFATLQPFDSSGAHILEAKIRVQDINNSAVAEAGVRELVKFQTQMKGCVELTPPDRLTLDTRVKYKPKVPSSSQVVPGQVMSR